MDKDLEERFTAVLNTIEESKKSIMDEMKQQYDGNKQRFGIMSFMSSAIAGWVLLLNAIVLESWQSAEIFDINAGNLWLAIGGMILIGWTPLLWWWNSRKKTDQESTS